MIFCFNGQREVAGLAIDIQGEQTQFALEHSTFTVNENENMWGTLARFCTEFKLDLDKHPIGNSNSLKEPPKLHILNAGPFSTQTYRGTKDGIDVKGMVIETNIPWLYIKRPNKGPKRDIPHGFWAPETMPIRDPVTGNGDTCRGFNHVLLPVYDPDNNQLLRYDSSQDLLVMQPCGKDGKKEYDNLPQLSWKIPWNASFSLDAYMWNPWPTS